MKTKFYFCLLLVFIITPQIYSMVQEKNNEIEEEIFCSTSTQPYTKKPKCYLIKKPECYCNFMETLDSTTKKRWQPTKKLCVCKTKHSNMCNECKLQKTPTVIYYYSKKYNKCVVKQNHLK